MPQKSFLAALFDLSFTQFITTRWVRYIFILNIVALAWLPLAGLFFLFTLQNFFGFIQCLFCFGFFIIALIGVRIFLEVIVVIFRIEEHTRNMAQLPRPPGP